MLNSIYISLFVRSTLNKIKLLFFAYNNSNNRKKNTFTVIYSKQRVNGSIHRGCENIMESPGEKERTLRTHTTEPLQIKWRCIKTSSMHMHKVRVKVLAQKNVCVYEILARDLYLFLPLVLS